MGEIWEREAFARLAGCGKLLHLFEYQDAPEEIVRWKNDEHLVSGKGGAEAPEWKGAGAPEAVMPGLEWYVGIGTYKTAADGEIYMCTLLDSVSRCVMAYAFGVCRSAELAGKALDVAREVWGLDFGLEEMRPVLLCSRNPIYRTKVFWEAAKARGVAWRIPPAGSRGLAAPVSTYFSQLMRRKGSYAFRDWQDAIDWLEMDVGWYNERREMRGKWEETVLEGGLE